MSRGQASVLNSLRTHLPREAALLIAVSGGVDSIALAHAVYSLRRELALRLEVAHLDHGLRPESAEDARFVETFATELELPFHLKRAPEKPAHENSEHWGRAMRYEFFSELLRRRGLDFVVTAHQADDVAETLLMRLVSNKEPGEVARRDPRRRLIRPFLDVPRSEIEEYVRENALAWREDASNSDETFLRNKVRHTLLPILREQFDARIVEVLASRAQGLAQDSSALDAWAAAEAQRLAALGFGGREWLTAVRAVLSALEPAVQWRLARDLLSPHVGFRLGRTKGESVATFLLGEHEGLELPSGLRIRRHDGGITLSRPP